MLKERFELLSDKESLFKFEVQIYKKTILSAQFRLDFLNHFYLFANGVFFTVTAS
jgi:hypothetical protein